MTRVAAVDCGTNTIKLLVADLDPATGEEHELVREMRMVRLGQDVDRTGRLAEDAQERVLATLDSFAEPIERHRCERRVGVLTSAVRDAANGAAFARRVRDRLGLDARTLSGDEEARLTYLGATAARDPEDATPLLVVDIGGGSTELVAGARGEPAFHISTQAGVVRHSERFLHADPPRDEELEALARDARAVFEAAVPAAVRERVRAAVAVAGTATSAAAIDLGVEPYDPARVEGRVVRAFRLGEISATLAALPLEERRAVPGLHPDRAPTIVAGMILLAQVLETFGLDRFEASERDILWGAAIDVAPEF